MPEVSPVYLFDIPGGYELTISYTDYLESEKKVINPFLKSLGYLVIGSWYSVEKDSFGPLIREIEVEFPNGNHGVIWYG